MWRPTMLLRAYALLASSLIALIGASPPAFGQREGATQQLVDATGVAGAGPGPGTASARRRPPRILYLVSTSPASEDNSLK